MAPVLPVSISTFSSLDVDSRFDYFSKFNMEYATENANLTGTEKEEALNTIDNMLVHMPTDYMYRVSREEDLVALYTLKKSGLWSLNECRFADGLSIAEKHELRKFAVRVVGNYKNLFTIRKDEASSSMVAVAGEEKGTEGVAVVGVGEVAEKKKKKKKKKKNKKKNKKKLMESEEAADVGDGDSEEAADVGDVGESAEVATDVGIGESMEAADVGVGESELKSQLNSPPDTPNDSPPDTPNDTPPNTPRPITNVVLNWDYWHEMKSQPNSPDKQKSQPNSPVTTVTLLSSPPDTPNDTPPNTPRPIVNVVLNWDYWHEMKSQPNSPEKRKGCKTSSFPGIAFGEGD